MNTFQIHGQTTIATLALSSASLAQALSIEQPVIKAISGMMSEASAQVFVEERQVIGDRSHSVEISIGRPDWDDDAESEFLRLVEREAFGEATALELRTLAAMQDERRRRRAPRTYEEQIAEARHFESVRSIKAALDDCLAYYQR